MLAATSLDSILGIVNCRVANHRAAPRQVGAPVGAYGPGCPKGGRQVVEGLRAEDHTVPIDLEPSARA